MVSKLIRISLRYGAVAGVLAFGLLVALYYLGRHPLLIAPYFDFRILVFGIFIFFALKEFRDYDYNGVLYFWQAMIGGLVVVALGAALSALLLYIFGSLEGGFVKEYIRGMTTYLKTFPPDDIARIGKETYERNLTGLQSTNISVLAFTYAMQGFMIGFFVNIIVSVILRRQPKN